MRSPTPGGIISIQGNLTLNPSGSYEMDIGGTSASAQHDRTNVTDTTGFNGTIRVFLPTGYVPKVGEQFIAINATAGRPANSRRSFRPVLHPATVSRL